MSTTAVITAWSAVSPYGIGSEALTDGLRSRTAVDPVPAPEEWLSAPSATARMVPDFDVREALGKAGTRGMDRMTGLTAVAVRELLGDDAGGPGTGLVLGTASGSVQGFLEFTKASLEGDRPIDVPPSKVPNMAMNRAASASAIRHHLKGPNSTVAAGRLSGLIALAHARRLLADGRAERVLCGSVEEYSATRAHLAHRAYDDEAVLGEGCAMLLLEHAGSGPGEALAEVLAVHHRVALTGDFAEALTATLHTALEAAAVRPDEVWATAPGGAPGPAGEQEQQVLQALFDPAVRNRVPSPALLGDTAAATGAFQIASLLAAPAGAGRIAVITATDPDGPVGAAVLRLLTNGTPANGSADSADGAR
ncbi:3-oxoacyl-ACP synthase [Streptomyces sp. NBC_01142]|uniref:beta-ketoacyl synthase N-terminal-like domain-containing protein n=1 Tax=Streptomyces sp. NBC_01142 TaxID=2975865 RepID=UPI00225C2DBE|nr:beta-ketoacyl synthase N-terminal-like domain-containing protein [Streptomyces sp. NBC_01142]MCX4819027.1 3-oxoacyl-ACP synthase [Streptomyces sp. NBC_01142]